MDFSGILVFAAVIMQLAAMVMLFVDMFRFFKLSKEEQAAYHYEKKRKKRAVVLFVGGYILLILSGVLEKLLDGFSLWSGILMGFDRCEFTFVALNHYIAFCLFGVLLYFDHRGKK